MSFKMNCDRCDRFIKNITADQMREALQKKDETVCKDCAATEEALQKFVELKKNAAIAAVNRVANEFKEEIRREIKEKVTEQFTE